MVPFQGVFCCFNFGDTSPSHGFHWGKFHPVYRCSNPISIAADLGYPITSSAFVFKVPLPFSVSVIGFLGLLRAYLVMPYLVSIAVFFSYKKPPKTDDP